MRQTLSQTWSTFLRATSWQVNMAAPQTPPKADVLTRHVLSLGSRCHVVRVRCRNNRFGVYIILGVPKPIVFKVFNGTTIAFLSHIKIDPRSVGFRSVGFEQGTLNIKKYP